MSQDDTDDRVAAMLVQTTARAHRNVAALGKAIRAAQIDASPQLARAVQAEENLYAAIDAEFGLLTSAEAAERMGSRAQRGRRNAASSARRDGRLLALQRGQYLLFPGFQFDGHGIRPVIAEYLELGREFNRSEVGLIQWLVRPTTYLDGKRPVDVIDDPGRLLSVARDAFGIQW
jgi:hypothetical protein